MHSPPAASHVAAPPLDGAPPSQIGWGGFDFCRLQSSTEQPASRQAASLVEKQHSPLLVSTRNSHVFAFCRAVPPTPHLGTAASASSAVAGAWESNAGSGAADAGGVDETAG
jgi:hypothetical protein